MHTRLNISSSYTVFQNLPFGETMVELGGIDYDNPYKFNGKELDPETGNYYYGARYYNPKVSQWLSVDPLAEKYAGFSPYNYTLNNPVMLVDPDGKKENPVFGSDGKYRGNTKEGYTGQPIIYDGSANFEKMTASQLTDGFGGNYWQTDIALTPNATAKIYNHILDNVNFSIDSFYDVLDNKTYPKVSGTFKLSSIYKKSIQVYSDKTTNFLTSLKLMSISADIQLGVTPTVENIRSTAIIHEYYTHMILKLTDGNFSHRISYLATMYSNFWQSTTVDYKRSTGRKYFYYYNIENFSNAVVIPSKK